MTLIQTGKIRNFPVILFGTDYWRGLFEWTRDVLLAEGKISPEDLDLIVLTDSPEEVVETILRASRGDVQQEEPESPQKYDAQ